MIVYNYSKLIEKINKLYPNKANFYTIMDYTETDEEKILKGTKQFSQLEITKLCSILNINEKEIGLFFFTYELRKT